MWSVRYSETNGVCEDMRVRIAEFSRQLGEPIGLLSLNAILCSSWENVGRRGEGACTYRICAHRKLEAVEEN